MKTLVCCQTWVLSQGRRARRAKIAKRTDDKLIRQAVRKQPNYI